MSLRNQQVGGYPLSRGGGVIATIFSACLVWVLSINVWIPLFGQYFFQIPQELVIYIAYGSALLYLGSCDWGIVPQGKERSQLFFGMPTGASFSAGGYLLPKLPFPLVIFIVKVCASNEVSGYLGWTLKGDVGIASITIPVEVEGMTSDGYRVALEVPLIFEVGDATVYLAQTIEGVASAHAAISATSSSQIKRLVVAQHSALELHTGTLTNGDTVAELVTVACSFVERYGLYLFGNPIVKVRFLSGQVERAFDINNAQTLLAKNAVATGLSFVEFQKMIPDVSEEVAMVLFSQARAEQTGVPRFNVYKIK